MSSAPDLAAALMAIVREEIDAATQRIEKRVARLARQQARAPRAAMASKRAGGLARSAKLTPEQRTEFARLGAAARWGHR